MLDSRITSEFFRHYLVSEDADKCWIWCGDTNKDGYGIVTVGRKHYRAHRISYLIANNLETLDLLVLHKPIVCNSRACVNPKHLYAGTNADNTKDSIITGTHFSDGKNLRQFVGEKHGMAILSDEKIVELRTDRRKGMTYKKLALKYGISLSQVGRIVNREQRK